MSTTALNEGRDYFVKCMKEVHEGWTDNKSSARGRFAEFIAMNESRLIRLEYKFEEMADIGGELYRRLRLAYLALCEKNEAAADELRAERLKLKATRKNGYAVDQGHASAGNRVDAPVARTEE